VVCVTRFSGEIRNAARALVAHSDLDAKTIVAEAMQVAASICVFTNDHVTVEVL